jgi:hypothetical protein
MGAVSEAIWDSRAGAQTSILKGLPCGSKPLAPHYGLTVTMVLFVTPEQVAEIVTAVETVAEVAEIAVVEIRYVIEELPAGTATVAGTDRSIALELAS